MSEPWEICPEVTQEDENFIEELVVKKLNIIYEGMQMGLSKNVESSALDLPNLCSDKNRHTSTYNRRQQVIKWICDTFFENFINPQKESEQNVINPIKIIESTHNEIKTDCQEICKNKQEEIHNEDHSDLKKKDVGDDLFELKVGENVNVCREDQYNQDVSSRLRHNKQLDDETKEDIHEQNWPSQNATSLAKKICEEIERRSHEMKWNKPNEDIFILEEKDITGDSVELKVKKHINTYEGDKYNEDLSSSSIQNKQSHDETIQDSQEQNCLTQNATSLARKIYQEIERRSQEMNMNKSLEGKFSLKKEDIGLSVSSFELEVKKNIKLHERDKCNQKLNPSLSLKKQQEDEIKHDVQEQKWLIENINSLEEGIHGEIKISHEIGKKRPNGENFSLDEKDINDKSLELQTEKKIKIYEEEKYDKDKSYGLGKITLSQEGMKQDDYKQNRPSQNNMLFVSKTFSGTEINRRSHSVKYINKANITEDSLVMEKKHISHHRCELDMREDLNIHNKNKYNQDFKAAKTNNNFRYNTKKDTNSGINFYIKDKDNIKDMKSERDAGKGKWTVENNYHKTKSLCSRELPRCILPMKDKSSPYYIDNKIVPRFIYEDGLKLKKWNPTQVMYEICSQCDWPPPEFIQMEYTSEKGFLISVRVKGRNFIPRQRGRTKKEAKHYASSHFLHFLGFEFSFEYKKTTVPSILGHNNEYNNPRLNHIRGRENFHIHTHPLSCYHPPPIKQDKDYKACDSNRCKKRGSNNYFYTSTSHYPEAVKKYIGFSLNHGVTREASPSPNSTAVKHHYHDSESISRRGVKRVTSQTYMSDDDHLNFGDWTSEKNYKKKCTTHTHNKTYQNYSQIKKEKSMTDDKKYKTSRTNEAQKRKTHYTNREPAYLIDSCIHDTF